MQPLSERARGNAVREPRNLWVQAESILAITRVVSSLGRAASFYRTALGFQQISEGPVDPELLKVLGVSGRTADQARLRLGEEELVLVEFDSPGREYPPDSRSDDLWFQHLAIVVSDMSSAYDRLRSSDGWRPISAEGPEVLPPASGSVRAFKFRDPDGHPLELLWFPPGQGREVWRGRSRAASLHEPFLGIDHSALSVSSTRRSLAFYGSLGMRVSARSSNSGPAQARLDGLANARVRVTGLRPASSTGPGLELLAYRPAGRPAETSGVTDMLTDWTVLSAVMAGSSRHAAAPGTSLGRASEPLKRTLAVSDPDGHRFVLVSQGMGSLGRPA